mmetsp:Transcript_29871/g.58604  ORF Transcript_29871/g.58604 Transcript_29871/m.58604 type:complete len:216 (+) Transcript_29871:1270-1917(+)
MLCQGLGLLHEFHLVLQNDDMFEPHDLHCGQMLRRLRLRARLVASNQKKSRVHHRGPVQHCGHENIVARTVHKGDVPDQVELSLLSHKRVGRGRPRRGVAVRRLQVGALVDLCVCVTEFDGDIPLLLVLEPNRLDSRDGPHHCGLSVSHMPDRAEVDGCLSTDHFWAEWSQLAWVQCGKVLLCQVIHGACAMSLRYTRLRKRTEMSGWPRTVPSL